MNNYKKGYSSVFLSFFPHGIGWIFILFSFITIYLVRFCDSMSLCIFMCAFHYHFILFSIPILSKSSLFWQQMNLCCSFIFVQANCNLNQSLELYSVYLIRFIKPNQIQCQYEIQSRVAEYTNKITTKIQ